MQAKFTPSRVAYTLDGKYCVLQFGTKQFDIRTAAGLPVRLRTNGAGMRFRTFSTAADALAAL